MHPGSSCMSLFHCGVLLTVFTDGVLILSSLNFPFNLVAVFPMKPLRTWLGQDLSSIITQNSICNNNCYSCINNGTLVTSVMQYNYVKWLTNFERLNLQFICQLCYIMQLELRAKVPSHTAEMESKFTGF